MEAPKVFISYSWDGDAHQNWVLQLANQLVQKGVNVTLDQYELRLGKNLSQFMEQAVTDADKVLLILTENYKKKAEGRQGGVGYEYSMINSEWYNNQTGNTKFIPILRGETKKTSVPIFVNAFVYLDMRKDAQFAEQFDELLRDIYDQPKIVKPPLGPRPTFLNPIIASQNETGTTEEHIQEARLKHQAEKRKKEQGSLIRKFIGNNQTRKAISTFQQIAQQQNNTELENQLSSLSADYQRYLKEKRLGVSSSDEEGRRFARVNYGLLGLIDLIS